MDLPVPTGRLHADAQAVFDALIYWGRPICSGTDPTLGYGGVSLLVEPVARPAGALREEGIELLGNRNGPAGFCGTGGSDGHRPPANPHEPEF